MTNKATGVRWPEIYPSLQIDSIMPGKDKRMAKKPNYSFEKRQKEIARKAKQDEKNKRKQDEKTDESTKQD